MTTLIFNQSTGEYQTSCCIKKTKKIGFSKSYEPIVKLSCYLFCSSTAAAVNTSEYYNTINHRTSVEQVVLPEPSTNSTQMVVEKSVMMVSVMVVC